jgi:hypothetical protein
MSGEPLEELRHRWAEEAAERAEQDAVVDVDAHDEPDPLADREAVIEALRAEPEDPIGSPWRAR